MKRITLVLLPLILLCGCVAQGNITPTRNAAQAPTEDARILDNPESGFFYDPSRYPIESNDSSIACGPWYDNLNELDSNIQDCPGRPGLGLAVIFEVAGKSTTRIIENDWDTSGTKIYGKDHTLTPVKILDVLYQGDKVSVKKGDVISVVEGYVLVTEAVKEQRSAYANQRLNTVRLNDCYEPLEQGRAYLAYLVMGDESLDEMYTYQGKLPAFSAYSSLSIYCLSDDQLSDAAAKDRNYASLWQDARKKYIPRYEEILAAREK